VRAPHIYLSKLGPFQLSAGCIVASGRKTGICHLGRYLNPVGTQYAARGKTLVAAARRLQYTGPGSASTDYKRRPPALTVDPTNNLTALLTPGGLAAHITAHAGEKRDRPRFCGESRARLSPEPARPCGVPRGHWRRRGAAVQTPRAMSLSGGGCVVRVRPPPPLP